MRHSPARLLMLALSALVAAVATRDAASARAPRVGVLRSAASLRVSGWIGAWETDGSIKALRSLGLDVVQLFDGDLAGSALDEIDVLVVPNARCVTRVGATHVRDWVLHKGGRLLATGMASYRDEKNQRVGETNEFQWADLYGAGFQRWLGAWPHCEWLALDDKLAAEVGAAMRGPSLHRIELGRNTAMLVRAKGDAQVLATWLDADGKTPTTDSGSASAAIVQNGHVIYVGENLLAPELSRSPQVLALVLALLRRLDASVPLTVPLALLKAPAQFDFPVGPKVEVAPGGPFLRVGIHSSLHKAAVVAPGGLRLSVRGQNIRGPFGHETLEVDRGTVIALEALPKASDAQTVDVVAVHGGAEHVFEGKSLPFGGEVVTIAPRIAGKPIQFLQVRPNGSCKAQAFRGSIELTPHGDTMSVVNVISAEEYAAGVVPNETPAVYPQGALETMAVIARTFGLSRRGYHKSRGYDVCNTVDCQMYGGYLTEWANANEAVNATRNQTIQYQGKLADSTFHAVCGGIGEDVQLVWPQPATPYLVGRPDGPKPIPDISGDEAFRAFVEHPPESYCSASPRFRWREKYTLQQLQALFEKSLPVSIGAAFHGLGTLQSVRVTDRSPRGRVQKMEIVGTDGTYVVEKDRIRWLWSGGKVGQGGLQSTLFRITQNPDGTLEFAGGGWGHGVGMCQEGAAGMATRGLGYRAIIDHYYPHTTVAPLQETSR